MCINIALPYFNAHFVLTHRLHIKPLNRFSPLDFSNSPAVVRIPRGVTLLNLSGPFLRPSLSSAFKINIYEHIWAAVRVLC